MPDADILTEQDVEALSSVRIRRGWFLPPDALADLARSHELLRARLAEAERERDKEKQEWRASIARAWRRVDDAEARLAEAQAELGREAAAIKGRIVECAEEGNSGALEAAYHRARLGGIEHALAVLASSGADSGKGRTLSEEEAREIAAFVRDAEPMARAILAFLEGERRDG